MFTPPSLRSFSHRARADRRLLAGYTLLEVCMVICIVGVLSTLTAQGANMALGKRTVEAISQQFAMDVQYAKSLAVAQHRNVAISFISSTAGKPACYSIYFGASGECICQPNGESVCLGDGSNIKTVLIPTTHKVSMRSNVATMQIESSRGLVTPTGSLTLESIDGPALKQIVNIAGRVRTCALSDAASGYPIC